MTTEADLQTCIKGRDGHLFVDIYDDDEVWLNIYNNGGSAKLIIKKAQAREMIEALERILKEA